MKNTKKNLFISVPMHGYKDTEIDKMMEYMKDTAEAYWGEEFNVLKTHRVVAVPDSVKNERIYCLGDSISRYMSKADYYIGIQDSDCLENVIKGCTVENSCWRIYHLGENNALYLDYSIMLKNLKIRKRKAGK